MLDAPGIALISISFLIHSCTKSKPGSAKTGVPQSETSETRFPSFNNFRISYVFSISLFSLRSSIFCVMLCLWRNLPPTFPSSQTIKFEPRIAFNARIEMSSSFPIGVDIMYKMPSLLKASGVSSLICVSKSISIVNFNNYNEKIRLQKYG